MRVVATAPSMAGLFRLDQLIAALARERLWLTDAYFVGLTPYVQALCAAARDGVDVRLLVPGASDIPVLSPLSRAGYRPLLEAGVRVFEWNGSMLHAKSAVADGRWARVGSTNLNMASFWANYELDVAVEDERVAGAVAEMYEQDLERATEIVLARRNRVRPSQRAERRGWRPRSGSAGRAAAGALSLGSAVGAAIKDHRVLGPAEARVLGVAAIVLLALAAVGLPVALAAGDPAGRAGGLHRHHPADPGPAPALRRRKGAGRRRRGQAGRGPPPPGRGRPDAHARGGGRRSRRRRRHRPALRPPTSRRPSPADGRGRTGSGGRRVGTWEAWADRWPQAPGASRARRMRWASSLRWKGFCSMKVPATVGGRREATPCEYPEVNSSLSRGWRARAWAASS